MGAELLDGPREFAFADRVVPQFRDDVVNDRFDLVAIAAGQGGDVDCPDIGIQREIVAGRRGTGETGRDQGAVKPEDLPMPAPPRPIGLPPERMASATKIAGASG